MHVRRIRETVQIVARPERHQSREDRPEQERVHQTTRVDECLIAVAWDRTPDVSALLSKARPVVIYERAIRIVDEKVDETRREELPLVQAVLARGREILVELLHSLDRPGAGEPWLVVRCFFALELEGAEHPGHRVAHVLETRRVAHDVQICGYVEYANRLEQGMHDRRRTGQKSAHPVLKDSSHERALQLRRHALQRILVHGAEAVFAPPMFLF